MRPVASNGAGVGLSGGPSDGAQTRRRSSMATGWATVASLPLLTVELFDVVFLALALQLGASVGLGSSTLGLLYAVRLVVGGAVSLAMGSLAHRGLATRWTVLVEAAVAWSALGALAAFT